MGDEVKQTSLKIKALPQSPDTDLDSLKEEVKESLDKAGAMEVKDFDKQDLAFGLQALVITIIWPDNKETEEAEKAIQKVEGIKNTEVMDYRLIS